MRKLFIKIFDKFLIGLMACTGLFSGCETVVEYGTPTADYEIKGTVTDSITSIPIQKARVIVTLTKKYLQQDTTITIVDTLASTLTDVSGKYDIQFKEFPLEEISLKLKVNDEDGAANGGDFASSEKDVVFKSSDLEIKKSGWYVGKATKTQDIKLQTK